MQDSISILNNIHLLSIFTNHLIYFNVYRMLEPKEIVKLFCVSDLFKNSIIDYISSTFQTLEWLKISCDIDMLNYKNFLHIFANKIYWSNFCKLRNDIPEDFIREFHDNVNWLVISKYQKLSENFIREFQNKVEWPQISKYQILSENFIREFLYEINWYNISQYQVLSEKFIRDFEHKVNWILIWEYQVLSEEFIREFHQHHAYWSLISEHQILSENFIREFKYKVDWECISEFQTLSEDFIREFKNFVYYDAIIIFQKPSREFMIEIERWLLD